MVANKTNLQILELSAIAGYKPNSICVSIIDTSLRTSPLPALSNVIAKKVDLDSVKTGKQYVIQTTDGCVYVKTVKSTKSCGLTLNEPLPNCSNADDIFIHSILVKQVYEVYRIEIDRDLDHRTMS